MRVLHGIWADGALCLWAAAAPCPPSEQHSGDGPAAHPFACPPAEVADLLEPVSELVRKGTEAELTLALPSVAGVPVDATPTARRPKLMAWRIPVLRFAPPDALPLLAAVDDANVGSFGRYDDGNGQLSSSIPYLAAVARMAGALARRGRVLPVLIEEPGGYAARWRPVLAGTDAQRVSDLVAAMPPACRAAGVEDAAEALAAALNALADAAARARLREPLLPAAKGRATVQQRFVQALTTTDAQVRVRTERETAQAAELAAELGAWLDGARMPAGPVRTCFRLAEPAAPGSAEAGPDAAQQGGPWLVEFSLQSAEDPSLIVPATEVWSGAAAATITGADPVEQLLAGLGAAARLFPELAGALREAAPCELTLDTAGAFQFLKRTGPLLAGAGFGVLLPDWVRKARLGVKLTTRTRTSAASASAAKSSFGLNDIVDFRYDLAVGDEMLDADELEELARRKIPLVRLRGQWVELDEAHLAAALRFLERNQAGTMTGADALAVGLHGTDDEVPLAAVDADGWLGDLLSGQADRRLRLVPPQRLNEAGFTGTLRPYQERGLAWLSFLGDLGLGGVLADDMGLGKTVQLLALVAASQGGPTLLVCPMSLVGNWQREAARFTPELRVHVHHGADRLDGDELAAAMTEADLVITTYGVATRDRVALADVSWARVVCDEAQNIKNHTTRQAMAVRSLPAGSRIALTGTPVENRLGELWSIMDFANPGLLGPAERFRKRYAIPVERDADPDAAAALQRITGPFCLRRLKTDKTIISDLPDKQEIKVWCNLTAEQASLYQATVEDMLSKIEAADDDGDDMGRRGLVLATMAKLKQVCNHPAHLLADGSRLAGRSGKLARLEEICDEIIAEGDKGLCFTQYAEFGRIVQPYLAARLGCPVLFLHGGTSKKQRDELVASFSDMDEPALFLLSLKAAGTGLNLTAANHVIHFDRWWNPAVEDQATDRAFRIGQTRNVQVRKFICVGTLEERIDAMIEQKKALADRVVGTGEAWLTELSTAELRGLLELSPEAVSSE